MKGRVERPNLYIHGSPPVAILTSYHYMQTRIEDTQNLRQSCLFRGFSGDAPARQFESKHQRGVNTVVSGEQVQRNIKI